MVLLPRRGFALTLAGFGLAAATLCAQTTPPPAQTPVPKPFPGAQAPVSTPKPATPTPTPAPATAQTPAKDWSVIDPRLTSVRPYPGAEFLESFDAGRGQRLFVFGTNDPYASVLAFYKSQMGKSTEVSKTPAIQQFDLGSFDANTMAQRPSLLVKDYAWPEPTDAYLHVAGTTSKRFRTLIQIIPTSK